MSVVRDYAYLQFPQNPDINAAENHLAQTPESIPKWIDSENGQQVLVPDSDEVSLIARAPLSKLLCCSTSFPFGEYQIDLFQGCQILRLLSQEELEEYCKKASDHCKLSMEHVKCIQANRGKALFCIGLLLMLFFSALVILIGIVYEFAWVSVIVILLFVFGVGFCYEIINKRSRSIRDALLGFIEINDSFRDKGIDVKAGPNGIYLEFALQVRKRSI